ncbi:MAG: metal ABC transporter solute-binding protein, Zn/Mn family [Fimbriimonadaceae bacterium]
MTNGWLSSRMGVFVGLLAALTLLGCRSDGGTSSGKPVVVSTVGMIDDVVRELAGDRVEHRALMGPGVDPHLYKATAGDVERLSRSDLVLYVGLELEGRMTDVLGKMATGKRRVVAVGEAVPKDRLRRPPEFEGRYDPHLWFDPTLWAFVVDAIRDALIELDPEGAESYTQQAERYKAELADLDAQAQRDVATIPEDQRVLVTAHDAFGYFGQRYGFEVKGIQGTSTAAEASARDIRDLAGLVARRRIRSIFVESSVPTATIDALRQAVRAQGWDVQVGGSLFSDAMGDAGTPEGTYKGMFRHNVRTMVEGLR